MPKPRKAIQLELFEQPKKRTLPETFPGCWEDAEWLRTYYREYQRGNPRVRESKRKHKRKNRANVQKKVRENCKNNPEKRRASEKRYADNNPEKMKAKRDRAYIANRDLFLANAAKGRARKKCAMPKWVDGKALNAIYKERTKIEKETGVRHDVDHIMPLCNKLVCGLHVPWNLQIIPEKENAQKRNKFIESLGLHPTVANGLIRKVPS